MKTTLADALDLYLKIDRAPATTKQYQLVLCRLAETVGSQRSLTLITTVDILDHLGDLRTQLQPSTFRQYVRIIVTFFNWCVRAGLLRSNPATGIKARPVHDVPGKQKAVPQVDIDAILAVAWAEPRNYAVIAFLAESGCRIGACAGLLVEDVNFEVNSASVIEKGSIPATVYFGPRTADALHRWLGVRPDVDHPYMWTSVRKPYRPMSDAGLRWMIEATSFKAVGKRWNPHAFRHAAATEFANSGAPAHVIQRKLNHRSLQTTLKNYYPNATDEQVAMWTHRLSTRDTERDRLENSKVIRFRDIDK